MGFLAVPVVGLVSSWVMLGEPLTLLDLAGAATTFIGIVVVSMASSTRNETRATGADAASA
jgi:drug/metabolite transporter (DMT)-like permease